MKLSKKQDEKVLGREKTGWRFVYVLLWGKRGKLGRGAKNKNFSDEDE